MRTIFFSLLLVPFIWGCTIYRSEGRKQFEAAVPPTIKATSFFLKDCHQPSSAEIWLTEEFPRTNYELVLSEQNLEIWKNQIGKSVEIKTLQKDNQVNQTCTYVFDTPEEWILHKDQFLEDIADELSAVE